MLNFTFYNPVKIVFGKGMIKELPKLIPEGLKIMLLYGGGSIKQNGVYEQVLKALEGRPLVELGGIEPNPRYETCMKALDRVRAEKAEFLLAVGGGSALDGTKFIAASYYYTGEDPWDFMADWSKIPGTALPDFRSSAATPRRKNWLFSVHIPFPLFPYSIRQRPIRCRCVKLQTELWMHLCT
jgi:NADP-dependent alcohol dehydrogenase